MRGKGVGERCTTCVLNNAQRMGGVGDIKAKKVASPAVRYRAFHFWTAASDGSDMNGLHGSEMKCLLHGMVRDTEMTAGTSTAASVKDTRREEERERDRERGKMVRG